MRPNQPQTLALFDASTFLCLQFFNKKLQETLSKKERGLAERNDNAVAHATVQLTSSLIHSPIHHSNECKM